MGKSSLLYAGGKNGAIILLYRNMQSQVFSQGRRRIDAEDLP